MNCNVWLTCIVRPHNISIGLFYSCKTQEGSNFLTVHAHNACKICEAKCVWRNSIEYILIAEPWTRNLNKIMIWRYITRPKENLLLDWYFTWHIWNQSMFSNIFYSWFGLSPTCLFFFFFFFFFGHTHSMWKFLGQGSNLHHSRDPSHCSNNTVSWTCWATENSPTDFLKAELDESESKLQDSLKVFNNMQLINLCGVIQSPPKKLKKLKRSSRRGSVVNKSD